MSESCCQPSYNYSDAAPWMDGEVDVSCCVKVVRVKTELTFTDRLGSWKRRWAIARASYRIKPGIYAAGNPGPESAVIVSANYKLSFDHVRRALHGRDAWILVLDTKGINVWCAAGKGTFGTQELIDRIKATKLEKCVTSKRLIIPQLGAPGVCARTVAKESGFKVLFGPVRADDIGAYIDNGCRADKNMRRVHFPFKDRLVLVPVELVLAGKYILPSVAVILGSSFLLSKFWIDSALHTGLRAVTALLAAWFAGSIAGPALLPWLPGRAFSLKGAAAGILACIPLYAVWSGSSVFEITAWTLAVPSIASFITMNFTGTSTYTSPSGVKKEMKIYVPAQALALLGGIISLIIAFFTLKQA